MARSLIVGTAGHIDHGKSALVRALTGTDPDRLKEERERGITIDLGFAHTPLANGTVASFIDVPGHERFVRHMLAGAHGIDAVVLVVAADESVMPQTREHFHICRLLEVTQGLIALTKCDLVDEDTLSVARLEVAELVSGSFLDGAPVLPFSSRTGQGVDALRSALVDLDQRRVQRTSDGLLRLPVDRVFTLRGFGTVVTGTLVAGELLEGQEVEVLPSGLRARARGLQIHGRPVERAPAGSRTAVNLASIEVSDVAPGEVLTQPGTLLATSRLDVEVSLLGDARPLKPRARVRVHAASAEAFARIVPLSAQPLAPGATALAQIRLERPLLVCRGDRLVLRSSSPQETVGGARVLDAHAERWRHRDGGLRERLLALARADATDAAVAFLAQAGAKGMTLAGLAARVAVPAAQLVARLRARDDVAVWGGQGARAVSAAAVASLRERVLAELSAFHRDHPLDPALSLETLRRRTEVGTADGLVDFVLAALEAEGRLRIEGEGVALEQHRPRLSVEEALVRDGLAVAARDAGLKGLDRPAVERLCADRPLRERVVRFVLAEGSLQRIGASLLVDRAHLLGLEAEVRQRWAPGARLDVAAIKDVTGLSRKYVIPLLEYLDARHVTRRAGDERIVLAPSPGTSR